MGYIWDSRAAGTWELLRTVQTYPAASDQYISSMAVSGSKLVTGSSSIDHHDHREVRVWGLESLECEHTLRQPAYGDVTCLLGMRGEVWGGVGRERECRLLGYLRNNANEKKCRTRR